MDDWNTSFLLGWPIIRCYVSFRECVYIVVPFSIKCHFLHVYAFYAQVMEEHISRKNDSPWVHGLWVSINVHLVDLLVQKWEKWSIEAGPMNSLPYPRAFQFPEWMDASGYLGMNKAVANPGNTDLYTYKYVAGWCIMVKFHLEFWSVCTIVPLDILGKSVWPTGKSFANSFGWTFATIMLVMVDHCSDRSAIALGDKSLGFGTSF